MTRFWRLSIALSALCVALAALATGAAAKPHGHKGKKKAKPAGARIDRSFGSKGAAKTATSSVASRVRMALAPDGKVYALQDNLLLAFRADGKPARGFGDNGRLRIGSTAGGGTPVALTVDRDGRILLTGTDWLGTEQVQRPAGPLAGPLTANVHRPFVIRLLPDGDRDTTFGGDGEVDTDFGLPRPTSGPESGSLEFASPIAEATSISVNAQDEPTIGGAYVVTRWQCGSLPTRRTPFLARLTSTGAIDASFGGKGYAAVPQANSWNDVTLGAMAATPGSGTALFGRVESCGGRNDEQPAEFEAFGAAGEADPGLDPARPRFYMTGPMAIDGKGRVLAVEFKSEFSRGESETLLRLLPSGAVDTRFGFGGGIPLNSGVTTPDAIAVDAKNRTLVAAGVEPRVGVKIARYTAAGKRDWKFGKKGLLSGGIANDRRGEVSAMAIDGKGRIYTAGPVESKTLKTGKGIQITRFLPGS